MLLNRVVPFRVDADGERIGMDLHELGGGAYPEFVIHRDESYPLGTSASRLQRFRF